MNKRVEKNQRIYEYVNNEISKKAKANSNEEFKNTNKTLKSINPALFGNDSNQQTLVKKENSNKKNLFISLIAFISIVITIITIAMVIYYGTK